mgnify:CR=1 FL=1
MANINQVVAYNSTTRRFYATNPNDKTDIQDLSMQNGANSYINPG